VSSKELEDIKNFNGFRSSPTGESMEGKHFAGNLEDSCTWGREFYKRDRKPFHIVQFDIPERVEAYLFKYPKLDDIGPSWYADRGAPLKQVNKFCSAIVELSALPLERTRTL
jgi:hypothetical protein